MRIMDEMEKDIVIKSEKLTSIFAKLCLVAWCIYIIATEGVQKLIPSWTFLLLMSIIVVQFLSMRVMKIKMNNGRTDEE